jgi:hypothetical protein
MLQSGWHGFCAPSISSSTNFGFRGAFLSTWETYGQLRNLISTSHDRSLSESAQAVEVGTMTAKERQQVRLSPRDGPVVSDLVVISKPMYGLEDLEYECVGWKANVQALLINPGTGLSDLRLEFLAFRSCKTLPWISDFPYC